MRPFFQPVPAPPWLGPLLMSVRAALSDIWPTAIRLKDYATTDFPPAADWGQGLAYDSTLDAIKLSDGSNWLQLSDTSHDHDADYQPLDSDLTTLAANITAFGHSLVDDASAGDARTTLGLGTAAVKNTGQSGDAVPVLNGAAHTWANGATFGGDVQGAKLTATAAIDCAARFTLTSNQSFSAGAGFYKSATDGLVMVASSGSSNDIGFFSPAGTAVWLSPTGTNEVEFYSTGTTASAANAFLDSGSNNRLKRSTSSLRYKTDIQDLDDLLADRLLQLRPVRYRSLASGDDPAWSFYGFIAEEVAAVDPRLVHWGYQDDQFEIATNDEGRQIRVLKPDQQKRPDSVQYDRLTVFLAQVLKRAVLRLNNQAQRIASLETRLTAAGL